MEAGKPYLLRYVVALLFPFADGFSPCSGRKTSRNCRLRLRQSLVKVTTVPSTHISKGMAKFFRRVNRTITRYFYDSFIRY